MSVKILSTKYSLKIVKKISLVSDVYPIILNIVRLKGLDMLFEASTEKKPTPLPNKLLNYQITIHFNQRCI